jgi:hypothetical protein
MNNENGGEDGILTQTVRHPYHFARQPHEYWLSTVSPVSTASPISPVCVKDSKQTPRPCVTHDHSGLPGVTKNGDKGDPDETLTWQWVPPNKLSWPLASAAPKL